VLLVPVTVMLTAFGYLGYTFLFVSTAMGLIWVFMTVKGFKVQGEAEVKWAKGMFVFSINYLTLLSILMVFAGSLKILILNHAIIEPYDIP